MAHPERAAGGERGAGRATCPASVVINNFNYGRFLREAIESALEQTHPGTEVIVVDDGSTDDSREIIASFGTAIHPLLKENGGQGSALNAGIEASRGEVVLFLDADDKLLPTAVARALECFDHPDVVKAHWQMFLIDAEGQKTGGTSPGRPLPQGDLRETAFRLGPTHHLSAPTSGNAWSRDFLQRAGPVPDLFRTGADTYLLEMAPFFGVVRWIAEPQSLYRLHGRNFHSRMSLGYKIERQLKYYETCCAELIKRFGEAARVDQWVRHSWWHRHERVIDDLCRLPRPGSPLILIDDAALEVGQIGGRPRIPLPERNGEYWGKPANDTAAIAELERLRGQGASFLAVAWPAFWWLEHYLGFSEHLRANYICILENERVIVFDLTLSEGGRRLRNCGVCSMEPTSGAWGQTTASKG